jgi:hypothetical protein
MKDVIVPVVHLNGDTLDMLESGFQDVADALSKALRLMQEHHPNARNYYPTGNFNDAVRQHEDRVERVRSSMLEIEHILDVLAFGEDEGDES